MGENPAVGQSGELLILSLGAAGGKAVAPNRCQLSPKHCREVLSTGAAPATGAGQQRSCHRNSICFGLGPPGGSWTSAAPWLPFIFNRAQQHRAALSPRGPRGSRGAQHPAMLVEGDVTPERLLVGSLRLQRAGRSPEMGAEGRGARTSWSLTPPRAASTAPALF